MGKFPDESSDLRVLGDGFVVISSLGTLYSNIVYKGVQFLRSHIMSDMSHSLLKFL